MTDQYQNLDRKQKQIFASQYPYKSDIQLFDSTLGNSFESRKFFNNKDELMEFKEQAAKDDVALQKRRDFVVGAETTSHSQTISIINAVLDDTDEEEYRTAIELANYEANPLDMAMGLHAIQVNRLKRAVKHEKDADMGSSQETEATMANAITLVKLINDIVNGQKVDVQLEGSLSSLIMGMDLGDESIVDEEEDIIDIRGEVKDEDE